MIAAPTVEQLDRQLEIAVCRLADDLRFGQDASPYVGAGIEYVQSRPFVDGDSVRNIDWKVTARTQRYHVKEYEALKNLPLYLVVDTSASMAFSSRPFSKHKFAVLLAGGLGLAALRRLSPVGLLAGGERQLHVPPSLQRGRLFQWLHQLRRAALDEGTAIGARLEQLGYLSPSRSVVVVISDLHDPKAVAAAKRLAQRHDVIVLQLEDPAERGVRGGGLFHGVEAETGRAFVAHGWSRWFEDRAALAKTFAAAGVDYLRLSTDVPFVPALKRLLGERGGLARNTR